MGGEKHSICHRTLEVLHMCLKSTSTIVVTGLSITKGLCGHTCSHLDRHIAPPPGAALCSSADAGSIQGQVRDFGILPC
ncbi:hypothetical protein LEMLEM_LOCUS11419, partial [Lemmus lemmus]